MTLRRSWIIIGLVLTILFAYLPLLFGRFYLIGDVRDVYIPIELFFQKEIRQGNLPSWNPDVAWGFPVIASAQIGFFYPPLFLSRLLFPIWFYLPVLVITHAIFGAVGMFLFLRTYSFSKPAAYIGTISFVLSQFIWEHTTHLNILFVLPWFVWQLLLARYAAQQKQVSLQLLGLASIVLGMPFLVGQLQMPTLMAAITSIYFLFERYAHQKKISSSLWWIAGAAIGAFLLASAQIFPTLELFEYSSRNNPNDFDIVRANQHSFPVYHLQTIIFPRFFGVDDTYWGRRLEVEYGLYIGIVPLVLALFAAWYARKKYRFFVWLGVITFLLALGSASPFRLIGLEPTLWIFSAPARWMFFATFSLSFLAAYGFDLIQEKKMLFKKVALISALVVTFGVFLGNIALEYVSRVPLSQILTTISTAVPSIPLTSSPEYYDEKFSIILSSAQQWSISILSPYTTIPLILLLTIPFVIERKQGKRVLLIATAVELIIISLTTIPTHPWRETMTPPQTLTQLPQQLYSKEVRLYSIREGGDEGALFTDPRTRANVSIRRQQFKLLVPMIHSQFGIPGVEWPASLDFAAHEIALEKLRGESGYVIQDLEQLHQLNIGVVLSPNEDGVSVDMQTFNPYPRAEFIPDETDEKILAQYTEIDSNNIQIKVPETSKGTLLVRNSWFPGWQATIDGTMREVKHHAPFFQSIQIPSGTETIELRYVPTILYFGMTLTLLMGLFCVIVISRKYFALLK